MLRCLQDKQFGPVLRSNSDCPASFDFTLLFEELFFCLVPCVIVLIIGLLRFLIPREKIKHKPSFDPFWRVVTPVSLGLLTMFSSSFLILFDSQFLYILTSGVQVTFTALLAANADSLTQLTLAANILDVLVLSSLAGISSVSLNLEDTYFHITQVFLLLTMLLFMPRVRTQWLLPDNSIAASLFTTSFCLRFLSLCAESLRRNGRGAHCEEKATPESKGGIFNRTLFLWLNPFLCHGYTRTIQREDIYPLEKTLMSAEVSMRLERAWKTGTAHYSIAHSTADRYE